MRCIIDVVGNVQNATSPSLPVEEITPAVQHEMEDSIAQVFWSETATKLFIM
jgi:hypothetical protein